MQELHKIKLKNGIYVPYIGFGTCDVNDCRVISNAVNSGYRLIDTASHYFNEAIVSKGIKESNILRENIIITTKLWYSDMGYDKALRAFEINLNNLNVDYIDIYLIHWPAAYDKYPDWQKTNNMTWKALERLYEEKCVKIIGVCNFTEKHLDPLLSECNILPMIDQIECHPGVYHKNLISYLKSNQIQAQAWQPLGGGEVLNNTVLLELSKKYKKTVAQICLKWNIQHNIIPIVKTNSTNRMMENLNLEDFYIEPNDMELIDSLPYCGGQNAKVK